MNKNWYLICTKPQREKKVAALLNKKKIENYYPLNRIVKFERSKNKISFEPLFNAFVFVYVSAEQRDEIIRIDDVINFVYWIGNPVVLKEDEIEHLQQFTAQFSNIKLSKIAINASSSKPKFELYKEIDNSAKIGLVKKHSYKLLLPALGYKMIAEREKSTSGVFSFNYDNSGVFS
jgi:transcription antitermination factor NusG